LLLFKRLYLEEGQFLAGQVFLDQEYLSTALQIHRLVIDRVVERDYGVLDGAQVVEILVSQNVLLVVQAPILRSRFFQFPEIRVIIDLEYLRITHNLSQVFHRNSSNRR